MSITSRSMRVTAAATAALTVALLGVLVLPAFAQSATVEVTRDDGAQPFDYTPSEVTIEVGGSVTWTNPRVHLNGSAEDHPTNCRQGRSSGTCPWSSEPLPPGGSFTVEFPEEGTFNYFCAVHPYMEGVIVVGDGEPGDPDPQPSPEPGGEPAPEPDPQPDPEPEPTSSAPDEPETRPDGEDPSPDPDGGTGDDPTPGPTGGEDAVDAGAGDEPADPATDDTDRQDGDDPPSEGDAEETVGSGAPTDDGETAPFDDDDDGTGPLGALAALLVAASGYAVYRAWSER